MPGSDYSKTDQPAPNPPSTVSRFATARHQFRDVILGSVFAVTLCLTFLAINRTEESSAKGAPLFRFYGGCPDDGPRVKVPAHPPRTQEVAGEWKLWSTDEDSGPWENPPTVRINPNGTYRCFSRMNVSKNVNPETAEMEVERGTWAFEPDYVIGNYYLSFEPTHPTYTHFGRMNLVGRPPFCLGIEWKDEAHPLMEATFWRPTDPSPRALRNRQVVRGVSISSAIGCIILLFELLGFRLAWNFWRVKSSRESRYIHEPAASISSGLAATIFGTVLTFVNGSLVLEIYDPALLGALDPMAWTYLRAFCFIMILPTAFFTVVCQIVGPGIRFNADRGMKRLRAKLSQPYPRSPP